LTKAEEVSAFKQLRKQMLRRREKEQKKEQR
jgi:hypothetical protein